jgi:hypothetical protein
MRQGWAIGSEWEDDRQGWWQSYRDLVLVFVRTVVKKDVQEFGHRSLASYVGDPRDSTEEVSPGCYSCNKTSVALMRRVKIDSAVEKRLSFGVPKT